jgi:lysyl-tRNA synthetase class 1
MHASIAKNVATSPEARAHMNPKLVVPQVIEEVIARHDVADLSIREAELNSELARTRNKLERPSEEERLGTWAEILAFALVPSETNESPWRTYFGPMGSGTDNEGNTRYLPDITGTDPVVVEHWKTRAHAVTNPILKSRYADLAWDMAVPIGKQRRDRAMAEIAIDSYLLSATAELKPELGDQLRAAIRALDLAILIHDRARTDQCRRRMLELHRESLDKKRPWWMAFDRLMEDKNAGLTEAEKDELVAGLEQLLVYFSDSSKPDAFDPHGVQSIAERLNKHYRRCDRLNECKRLHEATARAFEHAASLGTAMLASTFLQTAVNEYHLAGLQDEGARTRILMQEKIAQSRNEMGKFETSFEISHDDMETFLKGVICEDIGNTFVRIAVDFLPNRKEIHEQLKKSAEDAPLQAMMPFTIMDGNQVVATIGSLEDDPVGRIVHQTSMNFGFGDLWLWKALDRSIETFSLQPEHFVSWANRLELFEDVSLLIHGVGAWYSGDFVKATHVLIPQTESGLRSIVGKLGRPVTKRHQTLPNVSVVLGMGDMLNSKEISEALGSDLTLYFCALYADPRGRNLRNDLAHGKFAPSQASETTVRWLLHTLLVFGIWDKLAEHRR